MKYCLLSVCLILLNFAALAQRWKAPVPYDSLTQKFAYSGVVEVANTPASELQNRARRWLISKQGSGTPPITSTDGAVVSSGSFRPALTNGKPGATTIFFSCLVECKDGKARYTFTDFRRQADYSASLNALVGASREMQTETRPLESSLLPNKNPYDYNRKGMPTPALQQAADNLHKQLTLQVESFKASLATPANKDW